LPMRKRAQPALHHSRLRSPAEMLPQLVQALYSMVVPVAEIRSAIMAVPAAAVPAVRKGPEKMARRAEAVFPKQMAAVAAVDRMADRPLMVREEMAAAAEVPVATAMPETVEDRLVAAMVPLAVVPVADRPEVRVVRAVLKISGVQAMALAAAVAAVARVPGVAATGPTVALEPPMAAAVVASDTIITVA
jgi:hypothetical protein